MTTPNGHLPMQKLSGNGSRSLDRILPETEVAERIGCSTRTLERWRQLGIGAGPPYVRVGPRRLGYRESDLVSWIAQRPQFESRAQELASQLHAAHGEVAA